MENLAPHTERTAFGRSIRRLEAGRANAEDARGDCWYCFQQK
jgi:hypothetical protein